MKLTKYINNKIIFAILLLHFGVFIQPAYSNPSILEPQQEKASIENTVIKQLIKTEFGEGEVTIEDIKIGSFTGNTRTEALISIFSQELFNHAQGWGQVILLSKNNDKWEFIKIVGAGSTMKFRKNNHEVYIGGIYSAQEESKPFGKWYDLTKISINKNTSQNITTIKYNNSTLDKQRWEFLEETAKFVIQFSASSYKKGTPEYSNSIDQSNIKKANDYWIKHKRDEFTHDKHFYEDLRNLCGAYLGFETIKANIPYRSELFSLTTENRGKDKKIYIESIQNIEQLKIYGRIIK